MRTQCTIAAATVVAALALACAGPARADMVVEMFYDFGPVTPPLPASGDWSNGEGWKPEICLAFDAITGKCVHKGFPPQQPVNATEAVFYKVNVAAAPGALQTDFSLGDLPGQSFVSVFGASFGGMGLTFRLGSALGLHAHELGTGEPTLAKLENDALIEIGSTGNLYSNSKAELSGGGVIRLVGGKIQSGQITSSTRIEGFGSLAGLGTFANQGVVDANVNGLPLVVQSGLVNSGQMRASSGGILRLATPGGFVDAAPGNGKFVAMAGSTVEVRTGVKGGSFRTDAGGNTLVNGINLGLHDFATAGAGAMTITAGSAVSFYGKIDNDGQIVVDGATKKTLLRLVDEVQLGGGGALVLDGPQAELVGQHVLTGPKLTNLPLHRISGAGSIRYDGASGYVPRIYNLGTIDANVAGQTLSVTVNPTGRLDNGGMLMATNGGTLKLNAIVHATGAAAFVAAMNGSTVLLDSATLDGGMLTTAGSGIIRGVSGMLANLANQGHVSIDWGHLNLFGTITNQGLLELAAAPGRQASFGVQGAVTLTGGGMLTLQPGDDANAQFIRYWGGGATLTNDVGHTLRGTGRIGTGALGIVNRGLIEAEGSGGLWLYGDSAQGGFTNEGVLRALPGSTLAVSANLNNFAAGTLSGGSYEARGTLRLPAGAVVKHNAAEIVLDGAGSLLLEGSAGSSSALAGLASNLAAGRLSLKGGRDLATAGDLANAGTVSIGSGSVLQIGPGGSGTYTQSAGSTQGSGTLQAAQVQVLGGMLSPGLSPGELLIDGDLVLGPDAVLRLELGDVAAGAYDRLVVSGTAHLGGALQIQLLDGFDPMLPFSLPLLSAASVVGSLDLPAPPAGGSFAWQFGPGSLGIVYAPVPEPRTWALMWAGLVLLTARSWRRRPSLLPSRTAAARRRTAVPTTGPRPTQCKTRVDVPGRSAAARSMPS